MAATLSELLGRRRQSSARPIFSRRIPFVAGAAVRRLASRKRSAISSLCANSSNVPQSASVAEYIDALSAPPGKSLDDALEASQAVEVESPVLTLNAGGRRTPFFYLHSDLFSGGMYCRRLAAAIGPEQPIHAVAPHGTAGLPLFGNDRSDGAGLLAAHPSGAAYWPYRLGGFCVSGLVAYEIARLLAAEGESVERLVLVNASPMPAPARIPLIDGPCWTIASNAASGPETARKTLLQLGSLPRRAGARARSAILKLAALRSAHARDCARNREGSSQTGGDPEPFAKRRGAARRRTLSLTSPPDSRTIRNSTVAK